MSKPIEEWLTQPGGLAEKLKDARRRAKVTGAQLAETNGWPASKVSKLENGRQMPTVEDVTGWMSVCGLQAETEDLLALLDDVQARHQSWRRRLREGQVKAQAGYNELVKAAKTYREYAQAYVPGMLQTAAYARSPISKAVLLEGKDEGEFAEAIAVRMQRQQYLYDQGKRFEFLIDEVVLWRLVCPPDVMHGQLDRFQTVIDLPNVRFGILPLTARVPVPPENSFVAVDAVVLVETIGGEGRYEGDLAVPFQRVWDMLWEQAVEGEHARHLIVEAARRLPME